MLSLNSGNQFYSFKYSVPIDKSVTCIFYYLYIVLTYIYVFVIN